MNCNIALSMMKCGVGTVSPITSCIVITKITAKENNSQSFWSKIVGLVYAFFVAEAVVAQLASARLSEREVSGSIFSDFNVCFDFPLIRVAIALNTRKTEH